MGGGIGGMVGGVLVVLGVWCTLCLGGLLGFARVLRFPGRLGLCVGII